MNPKEPNGKAQARTAATVTAESEQVTGEFAMDLGLLDVVFVDDVRGKTSDALVSVKRRIRKAVKNAGG
jgi:hypothetical protein